MQQQKCVCPNCGIAHTDAIAVTSSTRYFGDAAITFCQTCRNLSSTERNIYVRCAVRLMEERPLTAQDRRAVRRSPRLMQALKRWGM